MNRADDDKRVDDETESFISPEEVIDDWPQTQKDAEAERELEEKLERELERKEAQKKERQLLEKAKALIAAPDFHRRALDLYKRMGVIGEENKLLAVQLCGLSRTLPRPASIMVRGSPSSGKSSILNAVLQIFDPNIVDERSSMSKRAMVSGEGSLEGKILVLTEYHAGKDSREQIRLAQTEGVLTNEAAVLAGRWRSTVVTTRTGRPVVMTTTTESRIVADDLSRFQVIWADESPEQSLRVMRSRASAPLKPVDPDELAVWRKATSLIIAEQDDFQRPPKWLRSLPLLMPLDRVGIRRDFDRFLTFLETIALCRGCASRPATIDIELADYAVTYRIFEPLLGGPRLAIADQNLEFSRAVARLNDKENRPVTVNEIGKTLGLEPARV